MTNNDLSKYIIKLKTKFYDNWTGKREQKEKEYMKVDGKIYLFNAEFKDKKIRFELIGEDENTVTIKAVIDGFAQDGRQVHTEGIAQVSKKIVDNDNLNPKFIEKAQSIAIGKALSYLGYGLDYGLASAEEINL